MTTILVGTDTSASADLAVEDAAALAHARGAELLVLYVRKDGDLRTVVDPAKSADPAGYLARMGGAVPGPDDPDPDRDRATPPSASSRSRPKSTPTRSWWATEGPTAAGGASRTACPNLVLRHAPCSVFIVDTRRAQ